VVAKVREKKKEIKNDFKCFKERIQKEREVLRHTY
jgi:hypothetical protein